MNPILASKLPDCKGVLENLPIDAMNFIMCELGVPYTEEFHNSSEGFWNYINRNIAGDGWKLKQFITLLMFADTLLVKPEEV